VHQRANAACQEASATVTWQQNYKPELRCNSIDMRQHCTPDTAEISPCHALQLADAQQQAADAGLSPDADRVVAARRQAAREDVIYHWALAETYLQEPALQSSMRCAALQPHMMWELTAFNTCVIPVIGRWRTFVVEAPRSNELL